ISLLVSWLSLVPLLVLLNPWPQILTALKELRCRSAFGHRWRLAAQASFFKFSLEPICGARFTPPAWSYYMQNPVTEAVRQSRRGVGEHKQTAPKIGKKHAAALPRAKKDS